MRITMREPRLNLSSAKKAHLDTPAKIPQSGAFLFAAVLALGVFLSAANAQPFTNVYSFTNRSNGDFPEGSVVVSGNTLYGTTSYDGSSVFSVNTDGTDFKILHPFTGGGDGAAPQAGLILSGDTLYGTASEGGISNNGTIFAVSTGGTGFRIVYSFTNGSDGSYPVASLILSGDTLYGTASEGGASNSGTVFAVDTGGASFQTLYTFTNGTDGSEPRASLILSENTLYGTAFSGGFGGTNGSVFSLETDGKDFKTLYAFTNGNDGSAPAASLVLSGDTLYGTASSGGFQETNGTVFSVHTNGMGFQTLYDFTNGLDGSEPEAGLLLSANTLYGTASAGGDSGNGTLFSLNSNGTDFKTRHVFTGGSDGYRPLAGVILSSNTLYGTTWAGGANFALGAVFAFNLNSPVTFTTLYDGSETSLPNNGVIISGSTLYGIAQFGGIGFGNPYGSIFSLNTNGAGYTPLYSFTSFGTDGSDPVGALVLSSNTLYGMATLGGVEGWGSVFSLGTNGNGFKNVYVFTNGSDGAFPDSGLILSGNTLYGTTVGVFEGFEAFLGTNGTIFSVNTNGTDFQTLYVFTNGYDGSGPDGGLILSGTTLFGTASTGGSVGYGTIFSVNTNGLDFQTLYNFSGGNDGADPIGGLILSGTTLYGTASSGGFGGTNGTVFSLNTNGAYFTTLYVFTNGADGSARRLDFIGRHSVWDRVARRQCGRWHDFLH
jgi:uncharacterized repeat protein (TIGR03803 family)